MTADDIVISQVAEANPVSDSASPTAQERAEAERMLHRLLHDPPARQRQRPRLRAGLLAPVASVLVVLAVAAVVLRTGGSSTTGSGASGGVTITLRAEPTPQTPRITAGAMSREIALMRRRLATLGRGFTVAQSGANDIVVGAPKSRGGGWSRIVRLITPTGRLRFFDWEANVLTPNGKTVASQLAAQDGTATAVSQGGSYGAGSPGPGSMSLYDAVTLAARQPRVLGSRSLSRAGPEYYMFGAPGSAACAADARELGAARPVFTTTHCLLAGPVDVAGSVSRGRAIDELAAQLPRGVNASQGQVVVVPQGTVVLQAAQRSLAAPVPIVSPAARFFVLRDRVALTGNEITNPQPSTDQSGEPDITFGFTGAGRADFQNVTRAVAHRGANVSLGGATLNQHFAVALDNQLVTVPQIDFRQYPDGVTAGGGADITGGFTARAAKDAATQLRYGALPLQVRVVP